MRLATDLRGVYMPPGGFQFDGRMRHRYCVSDPFAIDVSIRTRPDGRMRPGNPRISSTVDAFGFQSAPDLVVG